MLLACARHPLCPLTWWPGDRGAQAAVLEFCFRNTLKERVVTAR